MDQWNRIESPEINPHTDGQLIFDKGGENIELKKKKKTVSGKWCWGKLESDIQINDFSILPHTIHKNKLKMFQRPKHEA